MKNLIVRIPSKVNLGLNVFPKEKYDKHKIETIMIKNYHYHDVLCIKKAKDLKVTFVKDNVEKRYKNNPVLKGIEYISNKYKITNNFHYIIKKQIPEKAGLGGSSADAGVIIQHLCEQNNIILTAHDYLNIAYYVGSDIPFFIFDHDIAFVSDFGNIVKPIKLNYEIDIKIYANNIVASTKKAYDWFDLSTEKIKRNNYKWVILKLKLKKQLHLINNLQDPIFNNNKQLKNEFDKLNTHNNIILTGSGSYFISYKGELNED